MRNTESMVERVSNALAAELDKAILDVLFDTTLLAKAAIEAMRNPTDYMLANGMEAAQEVRPKHRIGRIISTGYQAMIDAALQESDNE